MSFSIRGGRAYHTPGSGEGRLHATVRAIYLYNGGSESR